MKFCEKNRGFRISYLLIGCLLVLPAGQILKAQDQPPQIEEIKKRAKDIDREIEKGKVKIQKFTHREADIIHRLNQVDLMLNQSRKRIYALGREMTRIEKKITATTMASEGFKQQIKASEPYVASRMVALYKLNWLGRFHILASAESLNELLQRKTAIERILTHDQKVIKALVDNQSSLKRCKLNWKAIGMRSASGPPSTKSKSSGWQMNAQNALHCCPGCAKKSLPSCLRLSP